MYVTITIEGINSRKSGRILEELFGSETHEMDMM